MGRRSPYNADMQTQACMRACASMGASVGSMRTRRPLRVCTYVCVCTFTYARTCARMRAHACVRTGNPKHTCVQTRA